MKKIILITLGILVAGFATYAVPKDVNDHTDYRQQLYQLVSVDASVVDNITVDATGFDFVNYALASESVVNTKKEIEETKLFEINNGKHFRYLSRNCLLYHVDMSKTITYRC